MKVKIQKVKVDGAYSSIGLGYPVPINVLIHVEYTADGDDREFSTGISIKDLGAKTIQQSIILAIWQHENGIAMGNKIRDVVREMESQEYEVDTPEEYVELK